jgi:hypothetical protein
MAHGASTTDDCPLCGGIIQGYWSEHEGADGTVCPFGPDHPDWDEWNERRIVCQWCGEPGDRGGDPLVFDNDQGTYSHRGCWDDCELCGQPLSDGGPWETYGDGAVEVYAHTACWESDEDAE